MGDGCLQRVTAEKHKILSNTSEALLAHFVPYCAGPKQLELESKKVSLTKKAGIAEPAVAKWTLFIMFVPKIPEASVSVLTIAGRTLQQYNTAIRSLVWTSV